MRWPLIALGLGASIAAAGCGSAPAGPAATSEVTASNGSLATTAPSASTSGTLYGVAGVIPANSRAPSADDWRAFYAGLRVTGTVLGVYADWSGGSGSGTPPVFVSASRAAADQGVMTVLVVGVNHSAGGKASLTYNPADPAEVERVLTSIEAAARTLRPAYLGIGNEVNLLAAFNPAAFDEFLQLYAAAFERVKARSPATKVFTVFQYEHLRGGAYLMGGLRSRPPSWDLLDRFRGRLDLVGLTTYPFFDYALPGDVPGDYYADAAKRAALPLLFTEVGWPAAPLSSSPASEYGGSPDEQEAFVGRFCTLTLGLDVAAALWAFPHDPQGVGPPFEAVALRTSDGTARPALARWSAGCR